jgi:Na+/proline symporter
MNSSIAIFLSQLVSMSPMLLVCLGGMVIAGLWWRRAPKAAMFAMAGLGITLLGMLLTPLIQMYVLSNRTAGAAAVGQTVAVMSLGFGLVRAVGMGLLIAAVFAGRSKVDVGFPVASPAQPPLANFAPPGR